MSLFLGQSLGATDRLPESQINDLYESEAFKAWKQTRDHQLKLPGVLISRIDGLSKQIAGLTKMLAR